MACASWRTKSCRAAATRHLCKWNATRRPQSAPSSRTAPRPRCERRKKRVRNWKSAIPNWLTGPGLLAKVPSKFLLFQGRRTGNWRSGRDSNPRYGFSTVQRFSKPPPSASRPPLQRQKTPPYQGIKPSLRCSFPLAYPQFTAGLNGFMCYSASRRQPILSAQPAIVPRLGASTFSVRVRAI